jgi:SAM-dependent methyltransferase
MIDEHVNNPKSPKYHVKQYLRSIKNELKGRTVLDIPAGNGATTEVLLELECQVEAYDLFPEYFMLKNIECKRADVNDRIPVKNAHADYIICQEGIEHFSDQLKALKEFNRATKKGGKLIITTPSYSNIKAKISYILFECEYFNKIMPPNEIDSIWMADSSVSKEIYHGHLFLIGIQKLRVLAKLAGFRISEIKYVRTNKTSAILFPFCYPFILLSSYLTYRKALRRNTEVSMENKRTVYPEQFKTNINPKILLDEHLFVVFEKECELDQIYSTLSTINKPFDKIM